MSAWHSFYIFNASDVEETLSNWLAQQGYTRYDPFNTLGGTAYPQALRFFVAPPLEDSVRLLLDGLPAALINPLAAHLSQQGPCLSVKLDGTSAEIALYHEGSETNDWAVIARRGVTPQQLEDARQPNTSIQTNGLIPLEDLPAGLRTMAQSVSQYQVGRLFQKVANQVMTSSQQTAAQKFLQHIPRWDSAGGQMLIACLNLLRVPRSWREPDFVTLRTAYWLHLRRRSQPHAPLLPGDEATMRRVPNALAYTPLYGGKV